MKTAAATQNGLLAIGAQQSDLRPRFINFAADFFARLAQGEKPAKPEPFVAEICAQVIAESVGAEVPMPMQVEKRTYKKREPGNDTPITGPIRPVPEAEAWMRSHGITKIHSKSVGVVSAFMKYPERGWKSAALADLIGGTKGAMTQILIKLKAKGVVTSEGQRGATRWQLAEMPPHV